LSLAKLIIAAYIIGLVAAMIAASALPTDDPPRTPSGMTERGR